MTPNAPPRVLHIVENLDRGAVENWLVRMFLHATKTDVAVDWTFYCILDRPGALDDEVRAAGGKIVYSPVGLAQKRAFFASLRGEMRRGRYDVIHCHHDIMSAIYLLASMGLPAKRRIVHVHNADENVPTSSRLKRALLVGPMRRLSLAIADRIVGISNHTLDTFLAGRPRRPGRDIIHYYGIDPTIFAQAVGDRAQLRASLGLPADALILLFGGRVVPEKNPVLTVDVLHALLAREPKAVAVFAGSGSLEEAVVARARSLGIEDKVRLMGWRNDLPEVMSASDWFILPRPEQPMEGFGIAVVEAQLAGLKMLLSKGVPDDPLLPTAVCERLSLSDPPERWAAAAAQLSREPQPTREAVLAAFNASPMHMDYALKKLVELHA